MAATRCHVRRPRLGASASVVRLACVGREPRREPRREPPLQRRRRRQSLCAHVLPSARAEARAHDAPRASVCCLPDYPGSYYYHLHCRRCSCCSSSAVPLRPACTPTPPRRVRAQLVRSPRRPPCRAPRRRRRARAARRLGHGDAAYGRRRSRRRRASPGEEQGGPALPRAVCMYGSSKRARSKRGSEYLGPVPGGRHAEHPLPQPQRRRPRHVRRLLPVRRRLSSPFTPPALFLLPPRPAWPWRAGFAPNEAERSKQETDEAAAVLGSLADGRPLSAYRDCKTEWVSRRPLLCT